MFIELLVVDEEGLIVAKKTAEGGQRERGYVRNERTISTSP